jgi:DNA-binding response OmpR family regulator
LTVATLGPCYDYHRRYFGGFMATILVVDDEPMMLRLCAAMLERAEHRVITAGGGEQALHLLEDNSIDLALLDVLMPGMNGIELAQRIENTHRAPRILLMSGYGPREITKVTGKENPYPIIWKPFRPESLLQNIENMLARS